MKKKIPKRVLAMFLSLALVLALVPAAASFAADEESGDSGETTTSGIELSKTATLEDDGTYTINLEAYATGTTATSTTSESVPLDIVMVIDESGSMTYPTGDAIKLSNADTTNGAEEGYYVYEVTTSSTGFNGQTTTTTTYYKVRYYNGNWQYYKDTTSGQGMQQNTTYTWTDFSDQSSTTVYRTRLSVLKEAATQFVNSIADDAKTTGMDHRISIVGYAGDSSSTGNQSSESYRITSNGSSTGSYLDTGLFIGADGKMTNYSTSLGTDTYYSSLVYAYDTTNSKVNGNLTAAIDNFACNGGTYTEYGLLMAQKVFDSIDYNETDTYTKQDGTTAGRERIVVLFTDGETNSDISTVLGYSNTLKKSTSDKGYGADIFCVGFGDSTSEDFLTHISSNYSTDASYSSGNQGGGPGGQGGSSQAGYGGTSVATGYYMTADSLDALKNVFSTITSTITTPTTSVTLGADAVMKDIMGDGFTLTDDSKVTIKTVGGTSDGTTITWGDETTNNASYKISEDNTTVSVTGFDYADKYISSGHAGEKLCVTITGVLPTDAAVTGEEVNTNKATSGIYATAEAEEATATFNQPQTILTKKAYVLDYAKMATLTDLDQNTSVTSIVNEIKDLTGVNNDLSQTYGNLALDLDNNIVTYTPKTTLWDGYDSFYVFGKTDSETITSYSANSNGNLWSKVSVIPANNVYYEDDFVTTYTDDTETETATVGIVYSKGNWSVVGESAGNTETANGGTYGYGWEESLANDITYSDGSAYASGTYGATAEFTFTGTGVDIYSRTNMESGMLIVKLTSKTTEKSQGLIINGLAESGDYYQIPTASFNNLDYDTYTVTLTVMSDGTDVYTYYLDGIRVYNPLGTVTEENGDAYDAYAADNELNAVFTEVRDLLITANTFDASSSNTVTGPVFIDEVDDETGVPTCDIATYKTYGPENEVYLAADQAIVFKVDPSGSYTYYLGLKAPAGSTIASVTNGNEENAANIEINAASDLYYEITPNSNGYIMVKNTGTNLLSITKLRTTTTTASASDGISTASLDELVAYANSFSLLSTVSYTDDAVTEEELEGNTETGDVIEDLDEDDIVIDNPTEDTENQQEEETDNSQQSIFSSLLSSIRNWFNKRR
ncbi:MAG: VWA domain-containing protein [Clostridiales bacterium]|nr:VWA domain-containing protein [Clostridiales bacterium]